MNNYWKIQLIIKLNLNSQWVEYCPTQDIYDEKYSMFNRPTLIYYNGNKEYYTNNSTFRNNLNDLIFVYYDGYKEWWHNNKLIKRTRYG